MPPLPAALVLLLKSEVTPKIPGSIQFQRHTVPENRYFLQTKRAMQMKAGRGWLPFHRAGDNKQATCSSDLKKNTLKWCFSYQCALQEQKTWDNAVGVNQPCSGTQESTSLQRPKFIVVQSALVWETMLRYKPQLFCCRKPWKHRLHTMQHPDSTCFSPYCCCTRSSSKLTPPLNIVFMQAQGKKYKESCSFVTSPAFSCDGFSAYIYKQQEWTGRLYYSIFQ